VNDSARHKPPSATAASVANQVRVVSAMRDVVPNNVKLATHCYGGRSGFGGYENGTGSDVGCEKSRQPEGKKSRAAVRAYRWKLGRESPDASWNEMHERLLYYIRHS
jgi:hypothetical protein